ncbi:phage tail sheath family protein [Terrabacter sp. RAF57]|uniref:phage tail sheath family protein n=1 Tax=Terrabacter sp. RAF57 TaxID=3233063 RepID=UPI003F99DCC5
MPEYLSPGVYVEEVDAGPKPIAPVATSTAGVVGVTRRGPDTPQPLTSYGGFTRMYGGPLDLPDEAAQGRWDDDGRYWHAAESVKAFFDEGGATMWFQRVVPKGAAASSRGFNGGLQALVQSDVSPVSTTVTLSHTFGLAAGGNLTFVSETATPIGNAVIASVDHAGKVVTLTAETGFSLRRGRDLASILAVDANLNVLTVTASSAGAWGDDLSVRLLPVAGGPLDLGASAVSGAPVVTATTADAAAGAATVVVTPVPGSLEAATPVPFSVKVGGAISTVTAVAAAAGGLGLTLGTPLARLVPSGSTLSKQRTAVSGATVAVGGAGRLYPNALVQLESGAGTERLTVVSVGDGVVTLSAPPGNPHVEGEKLSVLEAELTVRYRPAGGDEVLERHSGLRLTADTHPDSIARKVNATSRLVEVRTGANFDGTVLQAFPAVSTGAWARLGGGDDALDSLAVGDFVGQDLGPGRRTGIQALEDIDQVAICLVPGIWADDVRNALIVHCETLADRFAVLDSPPGKDIPGIQEFRSPIDTKFAALYYPWVTITDPRPGGAEMPAPPSGFVAGVYARTDMLRGVHKAPANETLRSIRGFELAISKREQDLLNPQNINVLRAFPGRGNRVWGARVLTSDSAWRYVPVRRLFLMIEESIDEATQWVVFEPNDEPLWDRIRQSVNGFLTSQWRIGALQGLTAAEAFYVVCDRSTMSQDDIDNGRLIVEVGIAPVKPAEFVIFRIQQKTLETVPA